MVEGNRGNWSNWRKEEKGKEDRKIERSDS